MLEVTWHGNSVIITITMQGNALANFIPYQVIHSWGTSETKAGGGGHISYVLVHIYMYVYQSAFIIQDLIFSYNSWLHNRHNPPSLFRTRTIIIKCNIKILKERIITSPSHIYNVICILSAGHPTNNTSSRNIGFLVAIIFLKYFFTSFCVWVKLLILKEN